MKKIYFLTFSLIICGNLCSASSFSNIKVQILDYTGQPIETCGTDENITFDVSCEKPADVSPASFTFEVYAPDGTKIFTQEGNQAIGSSTFVGSRLSNMPVSMFYRGIGKYKLVVKISAGSESVSTERTFEILPSGGIKLQQPENGAVIQTNQILFVWNSPYVGRKHKILLSDSDTFDRIIWEQETTANSAVFIPNPSDPTQELKPLYNYFWTVRLVNEDGTTLPTRPDGKPWDISRFYYNPYAGMPADIYITHSRSYILEGEPLEFEANVWSKEHPPQPLGGIKLDLYYRKEGEKDWQIIKDKYMVNQEGKISAEWFPPGVGKYEWKLVVAEGKWKGTSSIGLSLEVIPKEKITINDWRESFSISYYPVKSYYQVGDEISVKIDYRPSKKLALFTMNKSTPIFICSYTYGEGKRYLNSLWIVQIEPNTTYSFSYIPHGSGVRQFEVGIMPTEQMYNLWKFQEGMEETYEKGIPVIREIKAIVDMREEAKKVKEVREYLESYRDQHIVAISNPPIIVHPKESQPYTFSLDMKVNDKDYIIKIRCSTGKDIVDKAFDINLDSMLPIRIISQNPLIVRVPFLFYNKSYWLWKFKKNSTIKEGKIKWGTLSKIGTDPWDGRLFGGEAVSFFIDLEMNKETYFSAHRPLSGDNELSMTSNMLAMGAEGFVKLWYTDFCRDLEKLGTPDSKNLLMFLKAMPSYRTLLQPRRDATDILVACAKEFFFKLISQSLGEMVAEEISDEAAQWFVESVISNGYEQTLNMLDKKVSELLTLHKIEFNQEEVSNFLVETAREISKSVVEKTEDIVEMVPVFSTIITGAENINWTWENWCSFPSYCYFYFTIEESNKMSK
jgi:hypothetical protein